MKLCCSYWRINNSEHPEAEINSKEKLTTKELYIRRSLMSDIGGLTSSPIYSIIWTSRHKIDNIRSFASTYVQIYTNSITIKVKIVDIWTIRLEQNRKIAQQYHTCAFVKINRPKFPSDTTTPQSNLYQGATLIRCQPAVAKDKRCKSTTRSH